MHFIVVMFLSGLCTCPVRFVVVGLGGQSPACSAFPHEDQFNNAADVPVRVISSRSPLNILKTPCIVLVSGTVVLTCGCQSHKTALCLLTV